MKRNIAIIAPRFPIKATVGGAETLLKHIALLLKEDGNDVTFLTTCARNHFTWENEIPEGEKEIDGIDVKFFSVDSNRDIETFIKVQNKISAKKEITKQEEQQWLSNSVNSNNLIKHIDNNHSKYDHIIMGPYLFGLIYYASAIVPEKTILVPCLHDEPFAYLHSFCNMFNQARVCMFNADAERDLAVRLYGEKFKNHPVIGMGMEDFKADDQIFAKRHGINSPYIIYSGRREAMKGTPLLINFLNVFRLRNNIDIKLVLTGTGSFDTPKEMKDAIIDAGFLSEQEKHEAMAGALAFCHPSIYESFGIVLLESWLAKTPALVHAKSDVLRTHCKVSNGGLWFKTYGEFEEEMLLLCNNEKLRKAMGENGRKYVLENYGISKVKEKLLNCLDNYR